MQYQNDYNEDEPSTYVTYYNLEQACQLLHHSSQLYACLHDIDTPPGQYSGPEYYNYDEDTYLQIQSARSMWEAAAYDVGYRNAPIPERRIEVDMRNIHEFVPEWVRETPELVDLGYIMPSIEHFYYEGLGDGSDDLDDKQYAWEL